MSAPSIPPISLNKALLDANGNFDIAAASLDITTEYFRDLVKANAALNARWLATPVAPPATSFASREDDLALIEALKREEEKIQKGLESMGISQRQTSIAVSCLNFQKQHFAAILNITGGGVVKTFLGAVEAIEEIDKKLKELGDPEREGEINNVKVMVTDLGKLDYIKVLRSDRVALLDYVQKATGMVNQSLLIAAKVQNLAGGGRKNGATSKPGFTDLKRIEADEPGESE